MRRHNYRWELPECHDVFRSVLRYSRNDAADSVGVPSSAIIAFSSGDDRVCIASCMGVLDECYATPRNSLYTSIQRQLVYKLGVDNDRRWKSDVC